MSRLFISLLFLLTSFSLMAQTQIPNSNFEHWTKSSNNRDSLIGWSSSNSVTISPVISLYKETDSFEGQYAANLDTAPFGFVGYSTIGILINGHATFSYGGGGGGANVELASGGGSPISFKPTEVRGRFKYATLNKGDQGLAIILLTKYNTNQGKRDTVSFAKHIFSEIDKYTPFAISLTDLMPGVTPDTVSTIFYSSNPGTVPQFDVFSNLFLDSLYLYPVKTATEETKGGIQDFSIFPNPSSDVLKIHKSNNQSMSFIIYNNFGSVIKRILVPAYETDYILELFDIPAGIYYIRSDQNYFDTKKLMIIR